MRPWLFSIALFVLTLAALAISGAVSAAFPDGGTTTRVSVATGGIQGNDYSYPPPAITGDGRYVVFASHATNLVTGDTNAVTDVFVHDRNTATTTRISLATGGAQGNDTSWAAAISDDGRYIAFRSSAGNLVPGHTGMAYDIFLRDRTTGQTTAISVATDGTQANGESDWPSISADGRYVVFNSQATNLVPDDTNNTLDVFVRDTTAGTTQRISLTDTGGQANGYPAPDDVTGLDDSGTLVAFTSSADNLLPGDTNGVNDVYVRDWTTGQIQRASVASDGTQGDGPSHHPSLSADGRYVAFTSEATNLVLGDTNALADVFVHDLQTGETTRVSVGWGGVQGDGNSGCAAISGDGRYVAFCSAADNLVTGDTNWYPDVFVYDRQTGVTSRVSYATGGAQANRWSTLPALSDDGRYIAFGSAATNLVNSDSNGVWDVFVHDRLVGPPTSAGVTQVNAQAPPAPPFGPGLVVFFAAALLAVVSAIVASRKRA